MIRSLPVLFLLVFTLEAQDATRRAIAADPAA